MFITYSPVMLVRAVIPYTLKPWYSGLSLNTTKWVCPLWLLLHFNQVARPCCTACYSYHDIKG